MKHAGQHMPATLNSVFLSNRYQNGLNRPKWNKIKHCFTKRSTNFTFLETAMFITAMQVNFVWIIGWFYWFTRNNYYTIGTRLTLFFPIHFIQVLEPVYSLFYVQMSNSWYFFDSNAAENMKRLKTAQWRHFGQKKEFWSLHISIPLYTCIRVWPNVHQMHDLQWCDFPVTYVVCSLCGLVPARSLFFSYKS